MSRTVTKIGAMKKTNTIDFTNQRDIRNEMPMVLYVVFFVPMCVCCRRTKRGCATREKT